MKNRSLFSVLFSVIVMFFLVLSTISIQAEPVYKTTAEGILDDLNHTTIDVEFEGVKDGVATTDVTVFAQGQDIDGNVLDDAATFTGTGEFSQTTSTVEYNVKTDIISPKYKFIGWGEDQIPRVGDDKEGVLSDGESANVVAIFELAKYSVNATAMLETYGAVLDDHVRFTGEGDDYLYEADYEVNYEIINSQYNGFDLIFLSFVNEPRVGTVTGDVDISAWFDLDRYRIHTQAVDMSNSSSILPRSIVLLPDDSYYHPGESFVINFELLDDRYEFVKWTLGSQPEDTLVDPVHKSISGTLTNDLWAQANFQLKPIEVSKYNVTAKAYLMNPDGTSSMEELTSDDGVSFTGIETGLVEGEAYDVSVIFNNETHKLWDGNSVRRMGNVSEADVELLFYLERVSPLIDDPQTYSLKVIASENSNSGSNMAEITFTNKLDSGIFQSNVPLEDLLTGYEFDFEVNENSIREGWSFAEWDQNIYNLDLGPSGSISDHNVSISAIFKPNYKVSASVHLVDEEGSEIRLLGIEDGVDTLGTGQVMNTSLYDVSLLYNSDDYVLYGESLSNYTGTVWESDVHIDFYLQVAPIVIAPTPTITPTTTSVSRYTLRLASSEGGSFISFEGSRRYNRNTYVNVEYEVEDGYRFVGYSDDSDDQDINSSSQIKMNTNKELFAIFEKIVEPTATPTPMPTATPTPTPTPIEIDEEVIAEDIATDLLDENIAEDISDSMPEAGGLAGFPIMIAGLTTSILGFIVRKISKT